MLLDLRKSKKGETLVITDPNGDVHPCTKAQELWDTVGELLADTTMPKASTEPAAEVVDDEPEVEEVEDYEGRNGGRRPRQDDGGEDDDLVAEIAGRAVQGLLSGLQRASFRGKTRKRRKPRAETDGGGAG